MAEGFEAVCASSEDSSPEDDFQGKARRKRVRTTVNNGYQNRNTMLAISMVYVVVLKMIDRPTMNLLVLKKALILPM